jgi:triphosphoribosyl-dephospho-CoA synthase
MGAGSGFCLAPAVVAEALRIVSIAEVQAFKPGNVSLASPGHGMRAEDFVASADAVARVIAAPGLGVGGRILRAIQATREVVAFNTNLGIVLLCAPLAHAALQPAVEPALRGRLRADLTRLDVEDAQLAYRAIRLAQPGGLGRSPRHDVSAAPTVTLLEAMQEARLRDRIAWQYVTGFEDVFESGTGVAREALARWGSTEWAAVAVYLAFLARYPDSHVARKHGDEVARTVVSQAEGTARAFSGAAHPAEAMPALEALDRWLKARSINPGTSADLTVASLFAVALEDLLDRVYHGPRAAVGASGSTETGPAV